MTRPRVLIVDDDLGARETLEALILREPYELHLAEDGFAALEVSRRIRPDLILTDVMMPRMDGFEVCRRIRSDPGLAEIPIILVTALDDRESRLTGIQAGADDFITKPYDRLELLTRVRSILRLNRYRRLQEARDQFSWVIEASEDGYLVLDADDRIVASNPTARSWLGLPDAGEDGDVPRFRATAGRSFRLEPEEAWNDWPSSTGSGLRYLLRPETGLAETIWLRVEAWSQGMLEDRNQVVRLRDVTREIAAQTNLRSIRSTLAHKLFTPLTHVIGGLEMLSMLPAGQIGTMAKDPIDIAHAGAQRLKGAIQGMLDYFDGDCQPLTTPYPMKDLPSTAGQIAGEHGLVLEHCDSWPGPEEVGIGLSRTTLEAVLGEIFDNAHKFHPRRSPKLTITAAHSEAAAGHIAIRIMDDGVHLTPEQLRLAWSPGYQGEKYFTGETTGMGLGLAFVAARVWEAGGRCSLGNRPDRPGVIVEITVPVRDFPSVAKDRGEIDRKAA